MAVKIYIENDVVKWQNEGQDIRALIGFSYSTNESTSTFSFNAQNYPNLNRQVYSYDDIQDQGGTPLVSYATALTYLDATVVASNFSTGAGGGAAPEESETPPLSPSIGDRWYFPDTANNQRNAGVFIWDGTDWASQEMLQISSWGRFAMHGNGVYFRWAGAGQDNIDATTFTYNLKVYGFGLSTDKAGANSGALMTWNGGVGVALTGFNFALAGFGARRGIFNLATPQAINKGTALALTLESLNTNFANTALTIHAKRINPTL